MALRIEPANLRTRLDKYRSSPAAATMELAAIVCELAEGAGASRNGEEVVSLVRIAKQARDVPAMHGIASLAYHGYAWKSPEYYKSVLALGDPVTGPAAYATEATRLPNEEDMALASLYLVLAGSAVASQANDIRASKALIAAGDLGALLFQSTPDTSRSKYRSELARLGRRKRETRADPTETLFMNFYVENAPHWVDVMKLVKAHPSGDNDGMRVIRTLVSMYLDPKKVQPKEREKFLQSCQKIHQVSPSEVNRFALLYRQPTRERIAQALLTGAVEAETAKQLLVYSAIPGSLRIVDNKKTSYNGLPPDPDITLLDLMEPAHYQAYSQGLTMLRKSVGDGKGRAALSYVVEGLLRPHAEDVKGRRLAVPPPIFYLAETGIEDAMGTFVEYMKTHADQLAGRTINGHIGEAIRDFFPRYVATQGKYRMPEPKAIIAAAQLRSAGESVEGLREGLQQPGAYRAVE
ncbi:MAG: hypothetical protein ABH879_04390 [archaeon]